MSHATAWKRSPKKSSCPRHAPDSMQEHQRRQSGIAGGFVTEAAIPGFHGREMRHARPPDQPDLLMLTGLRRLESNNFIFKTIVQPSGSHSLASGGRKFTSC